MDRQEVKKKIEHLEYLQNGFARLSGADVRAVNVRIGKDKATADIILTDVDERHRYNNCQYSFTELGL